MEDRTRQLLQLGFGKCKLQIQVPEKGPVKNIKDLSGKRVVTSFNNIARGFFEKIDGELGLQGDKRTHIDYVGGSVEAACALGLADGIGEPTVLWLWQKRRTEWYHSRFGRVWRDNACRGASCNRNGP